MALSMGSPATALPGRLPPNIYPYYLHMIDSWLFRCGCFVSISDTGWDTLYGRWGDYFFFQSAGITCTKPDIGTEFQDIGTAQRHTGEAAILYMVAIYLEVASRG